MTDDKEQGIKRIRLIASAVAAVLFSTTAVTQFQAEERSLMIVGVLLSAAIGFGIMWVGMTIVKYVLRLLRR